MNFNTTNWSTFTHPDGLCNLLDAHGTVLATFTDWQVAEYVANLNHEVTLNTEIISNLEDKIAELEESVTTSEQDYQDAKEQGEHDHRTIIVLEKEIDELKTKLYNLSNE